MKKFSTVLILMFCIQLGYAGKVSLISERPGQALTAFTLKENAVQLQTGYNYRSIHLGPNHPLNVELNNLETTIRFGMGDRFEMNTSFNNNFDKGYFAPPSLGFRTRLYQNDVHIYSLQYTANLSQFQDESFMSSLTFLSNHDLSGVAGFTINGSLNYSNEEVSEAYVLSFDFPLTQHIGLVVEHYGNIKGSEWLKYFDMGFSYGINRRFQLDTYFGGGLNGKIEDLFINGGFTYRLDY